MIARGVGGLGENETRANEEQIDSLVKHNICGSNFHRYDKITPRSLFSSQTNRLVFIKREMIRQLHSNNLFQEFHTNLSSHCLSK